MSAPQEMMTFEAYQALAVKVPLSLRNNRDRVDLPVLGLQEDAGRIGLLLSTAFASGKLVLLPKQREELKDKLSDILWCVALLCSETGIAMKDLAAHSAAQLQARTKELDPNRR